MPKDEQARASTRDARRASPTPGIWQAAGIAVLSALVFGAWARPGPSASEPRSTASVSQVAEVASQDMTAALDTVGVTPEEAAQFHERDACSRRLAWVTIMRSPGQAPGQIRLQSGGYFSPVFDLPDAPLRVALPYPAAYASGHGTISILGATADAVVALTPPWHVAAQDGVHARAVTWTPAAGCPAAGR